jgi:hypothetical protein
MGEDESGIGNGWSLPAVVVALGVVSAAAGVGTLLVVVCVVV